MEGRLIPSNLMTWEKAPLWTRGIRNEDNPHGLQRPHTPVVLNNTIKYECKKCPYNLHSLTNDIYRVFYLQLLPCGCKSRMRDQIDHLVDQGVLRRFRPSCSSEHAFWTSNHQLVSLCPRFEWCMTACISCYILVKLSEWNQGHEPSTFKTIFKDCSSRYYVILCSCRY